MSMGTFSEHAADYAAQGLRVFPAVVSGDGDEWIKKPCIKNWRKAATNRPANFAKRFPDAAIGILNDNAVTVVDLDEPGLIDWAISRFGETPIIIETPRGGHHLWYKHNGERRQTGIEGRKVDILGTGGYAIAPPSQRPDRRVWGFLRGSSADIVNLPKIPKSALPNSSLSEASTAVEIGRNNTLFKALISDAVRFDTETELYYQASALNEIKFAVPLADLEVSKIVHSVWGYKAKGELWTGGEARAQITASELDDLEGNSDAALMLMKLRAAHGVREGKPFALSKAFAVSLGWTLPRYRKARAFLAERSYIREIHPGGRGPNDPPKYSLYSIRGAISYPNITRHLSTA